MAVVSGERKKLDVKSITGDEIYSILPDLARLRMTVFRDWPYLYDGTLEYEEKYLNRFAEAKGAVVIANVRRRASHARRKAVAAMD